LTDFLEPPEDPEISNHYDDLGNLTEIGRKPTPWSASVLQEKNTYEMNGKPHALTQGLCGAGKISRLGERWSRTTSAICRRISRRPPAAIRFLLRVWLFCDGRKSRKIPLFDEA
jgi:hypothetical protein